MAWVDGKRLGVGETEAEAWEVEGVAAAAAAAATAAATAGALSAVAISVVMSARASGASTSSEACLQSWMTWVYSGALTQCDLGIGAASIAATAAAADRKSVV